MRVQLAIDGTEVSLGRNDALQHGASEGDVKYVSRHEPRGNGSATRLYHFDDAGRLLILQLVVESLAGLAGDRQRGATL